MSKRHEHKRQHKDTHHIIPRSRCQELNIHPEVGWNKVRVNVRQHELYNMLFGNKTPQEAFNFLLNTFWNGMIKPPLSRLDKFPYKKPGAGTPPPVLP